MKKNTKLFLIFIALFLTTLACNRDQFLDLLPEDIIQIETDEPRKISGIVWVDSNMNGRREKDEDYLGGVEVKLYNKDGKVIGSTMTESGSLEKGDNYLITTRRISYGEIFRLEFILPKGYRFTIKSEDRSILGSHVNPEGSNAGFNDWKEIFSESVSGNNAGVVQESWTFIGDYVWHDIDRDGIQDEGELGMEGIIVTLYDAVTGVEIESTITDSNGWYGFVVSDATENSKYQLEFILPDGFLFTEVDVARQETVGINDFLDSDVFPDGVERGWTDVFSAVPGELNDWWDAGLVSIPPTATSTTTPTNTLTFTPTPTPTVTPSATLTPSVTPTPSITPTATWIIEIESEKVDYGDAPLSFPVAAADQGPFIVEPENGFFVYLGADIDSEVAPNIINEDQYDDGLLALNFEKGEAVLQTVASRDILWGTQYYINIVIDFNNNGNWQDEGEWVVQNCDVLPEEIPDSDEPLSTPIIKHCSLLGGFQTIEREGDHWVRVLLSTWKPSGPHWDGSGPEPSKDYIFLGEVEDYRFADVPVSTDDGTVGVGQAHCRYGDSKAYLHQYDLKEGDKLTIEGRNFNGSWLWVQPEGFPTHCWISTNLVTLPNGFDVKEVPIVETNLPTSGFAPNPSGLSVTRKGDKVTIAWNPSGIGGNDFKGYLIQVGFTKMGTLSALFSIMSEIRYSN